MFQYFNDRHTSILMGIIFAILIYFLFIQKVTYHGVNSNKIKNKIYKIDGKCYKFIPRVHICPIITSMSQHM